jgi:heme exporter protein CcmD
MDFAAAHIGFVLASYGISFVSILGLAAYVIARDRKLCAEAQRLDAARRREQT